MKKIISIVFLVAIVCIVHAQQKPYSQQMTETAIKIWPDSFSSKQGRPARWSYDQGVILKGVEGVWKLYGDARYFNYIEHSMDFYLLPDGTIKDYKKDEFNVIKITGIAI